MNLPYQTATISRPLFFYYRPPDGNAVKVPANFMPPFAGGELPLELKLRIVNEKPQDAETLLEMVWSHYAQTQAMKLARQKAELERITSGNPVLISEESIPAEFRQGVPMNLALRLSGLHNAHDIVIEMRAYQIEEENRRRQEISANPMAGAIAARRQGGVSDSMVRISGLPVSGMPGVPGADYHSRGMADVQGVNPLGNILAMQALATQGMIPDPFGMDRRRQQANEQAMEIARQYSRPQTSMQPGMALPFRVVPASAAVRQPAVAPPWPMTGSPNSLLTPAPA
mgnify:CR=1 FL=1